MDFPIEFVRENNGKIPVSTRIPIYKKLTTDGYFYPSNKEDFSIESDLNILLVSSDTKCNPGSPLLIGDQEATADFTLNPVPVVDGSDNEIDTIKQVLDEAKNNGWPRINVDVCHTPEISVDKFIRLIEEDKYHIIHYNGHGYYEQKITGDNNYIFFWEHEGTNKGRLATIDSNKINDVATDKDNLKFVYLSCCQSGKTAQVPTLSNNFLGLLDAIISSGVPAAVGMRWPVWSENSKRIAEIFYRNLFPNNSANTIEFAMMRARRSLLNNIQDHSAWCAPVLLKEEWQ